MVGLVRHDASVQLQRQALLMVGLVREVFPVVWLVRRQPRARRDPGRRRPRSAAMYSTRPISMTLLAVVCWSCDRAWDSATCIIFTLSQQTPRTDGLRFSSDRPFIGQTRPSSLSKEGGFVRCVLTDDTRDARAELLGEVDIVEGTRLGGLVMMVETRSTHTHTKRQRGCYTGRQYSNSGCAAIDPWERHRPFDP